MFFFVSSKFVCLFFVLFLPLRQWRATSPEMMCEVILRMVQHTNRPRGRKEDGVIWPRQRCELRTIFFIFDCTSQLLNYTTWTASSRVAMALKFSVHYSHSPRSYRFRSIRTRQAHLHWPRSLVVAQRGAYNTTAANSQFKWFSSFGPCTIRSSARNSKPNK